MIENNK